jgi:rhamnulokinase
MPPRVFGAVDVGASSGRVMAGLVDDGRVDLRCVHRFPNAPVRKDQHLYWDIRTIFAEVLAGLRVLAREYPDVESIGVDTWGVDYALVDPDGALLGDPLSYRDDRHAQGVPLVEAKIGRDDLYAVNGLQFLPFNTLYQLAAERAAPRWRHAAHVILLPDLLAWWLTGTMGTEVTNASTTGLLDARSGEWSPIVAEALGLDLSVFPTLRQPGSVLGPILPTIASSTGLGPSVVVTTVGSHDTASAVAAMPSRDRRCAYVSSGTWSLVGVELDDAVLTPAARQAGFTNERGVDARTRFLRNVGGFWLVQESMRAWEREGAGVPLLELLRQAAALPRGESLIDLDDLDLVAPGDMPARIGAAARKLGHEPPRTPAAVVRCVIDSLALAYAATTKTAENLSGLAVDTIHIVGGGSQAELLCQETANHSGRPVVAGPVEATALGNLLVQARSHGALSGGLDDVRLALAAHTPLMRYEPQ